MIPALDFCLGALFGAVIIGIVLGMRRPQRIKANEEKEPVDEGGDDEAERLRYAHDAISAFLTGLGYRISEDRLTAQYDETMFDSLSVKYIHT